MPYLTCAEAAKILGKPHMRVCRYAQHGLLPSVRVGQVYLIKEPDLRAFVPPKKGRPRKYKKETKQ